ncbi:DUF4367 domain-containing protein [Rossellomorea vietnamensis]|uniref:DUF4367 domain-containing protein n=1 Tax=Rossellomorea vietnamensis TaxID=218284 RepID=UPI003D2CD0D9
MKRLLFFLLVIPIFLFGCNNGENGNNSSLNDFDNTELKEQLKDQDFQPKLPSKTPIAVENAQFDPPVEGREVLTFDFFGEESHLGLMTVRGKKVSNSSDIEYEEVEIGELKGKYGVNDAGVMNLYWTDDKTYYRLTYYGKQSEKEITKEELIATAESFE